MFDKIKYDISNGKFNITIPGLTRKVGNMREEFILRAKELSQYPNLLISLSSGVDSQCIVHTFKELSIPIETAFLYLPGYNDIEFDNLQIIDKKYNLKTNIIDIDLSKFREQIEYESNKFKNHKNSILHKIFLSKLPSDASLITINYDPYLYKSQTKGEFIIFDLHQAEIQRDRAFEQVSRSGLTFDFGETSEIIYSVITDKIYRSAMHADRYLKNNRLIDTNNVEVKSLGKYDHYIKPLLLGKYWKNELIYFPKFIGYENIDWMSKTTGWLWKQTCLVPYKVFIQNLEEGRDTTYYENIEEVKNTS